MDKISIIVPCYNEQEAIPIFYEAITRTAAELTQAWLEVLFVNDGSKDESLSEMKKLAEQDDRIKYVSFSRNFGKEAAMYAGLSYADGDYVAIMDVDLQDPPALLPKMYQIITTEDYDCVATRRVTRKGEPPIRSFFARRFYALMHRLSKTDIVDGARDYRLMTRQFVDELLRLGEYNRFSKGLFGWVGFQTKWLEYENVERSAGETKWSFWKLLIYSIEGIVGFTTAPLVMAAFLGVFFCVVAFLALCFIIIRTVLYGDPVSGWPSMTCIIIFLGGIQLFCIGILGEYLAKTIWKPSTGPFSSVRRQMLSRIRDKKKLLLLIPAAVIIGLLVWNVILQLELKKYRPQVEAYLPEDIYVAVGSTVELYDDRWSGPGCGTAMPATGIAKSARIWRTGSP